MDKLRFLPFNERVVLESRLLDKFVKIKVRLPAIGIADRHGHIDSVTPTWFNLKHKSGQLEQINFCEVVEVEWDCKPPEPDPEPEPWREGIKKVIHELQKLVQ